MTVESYDLTSEENARVNDLRVKFRAKRDFYYRLSWHDESRPKVYKEAVDLLHERLYILLGL